MKRGFFAILFVSTFQFLSSQIVQESRYGNFNFILHLTKNELFTEAEREKERFFSRQDVDQLYKDSVNFILGMSYRNADRKDIARTRLMEVSSETFLYYKSHYLAGILDAEMEKPDSCLKTFLGIELSDNKDLNELKEFEVAGAFLLNNDLRSYDSVSKRTVFTNTLLIEEHEKLNKCYAVQKKIKRKSAFAAGALSAVIPGLGKVYAGNNGQALASFLTVGLMAGITAENYIRLGIEHPQTIFFAGMFSLFYIGNIWGSAVSVQVVKIEKEFENKHNILVGLKLPVSKFFR